MRHSLWALRPGISRNPIIEESFSVPGCPSQSFWKKSGLWGRNPAEEKPKAEKFSSLNFPAFSSIVTVVITTSSTHEIRRHVGPNNAVAAPRQVRLGNGRAFLGGALEQALAYLVLCRPAKRSNGVAASLLFNGGHHHDCRTHLAQSTVDSSSSNNTRVSEVMCRLAPPPNSFSLLSPDMRLSPVVESASSSVRAQPRSYDFVRRG